MNAGRRSDMNVRLTTATFHRVDWFLDGVLFLCSRLPFFRIVSVNTGIVFYINTA